MHAVAPGGLNRPGLHDKAAVLPPVQEVPAVHATPVLFVEGDGHQDPAGATHNVHVGDLAGENRPTGHTVGADVPPAQAYPAGQATPDEFVDRAGQ